MKLNQMFEQKLRRLISRVESAADFPPQTMGYVKEYNETLKDVRRAYPKNNIVMGKTLLGFNPVLYEDVKIRNIIIKNCEEILQSLFPEKT